MHNTKPLTLFLTLSLGSLIAFSTVAHATRMENYMTTAQVIMAFEQTHNAKVFSAIPHRKLPHDRNCHGISYRKKVGNGKYKHGFTWYRCQRSNHG